MWVLGLVIGVTLLGSGRSAAVEAAPLGTMLPLGEWLAADGSLALPRGASGSFDATGYRMVSGADEAPRFVPAAPGDENWVAGFHQAGVNGDVYALAVDGSGNVYAGGNFTSAGTCTSAAGCNFVAKWNGSTWSALGSGMNATVYALAVDGSGSVYAGGSFTSAGTCTSAAGCNQIAKWDGSTWSALGSGMDSSVNALAVDGSGSVYAGGYFTSAGTCDSAAGCNWIAKWDGSTWSALGSGMDSYVLALAVDGSGALYAGGHFTSAGTCDSAAGCNYVAKWDGSTWSALGSGMNGNVNALAVDGSGSVYAGGDFSRAGTCTRAGCNYVAKWNGSTWSALGSGMNSYVYALAVDGSGSVYAGGYFTSAGTCDSAAGCNQIAKWNGSTWSALGSGMNSHVFALAVDGSGSVYAGGDFTRAGTCTTGCNRIAKWNGSAWGAIGETGSGMNGGVNALAVDGSGSVYAGGSFTSAGTCDSAAGCNRDRQVGRQHVERAGQRHEQHCLCAGGGWERERVRGGRLQQRGQL